MEAIFGLVGVVVGALLTWLQSTWSERKAHKLHARYLAVRVVCILDMYVEKCIEVAEDDGLSCGQRDERGYLRAQVSTPSPPEFPRDVEWMSIDHFLMYRILSLPNDAERANGAIDFVSDNVASPPDFAEFFEEREEQYLKLGLEAAALAHELRKKYDIPVRNLGDWNPVERLTKAKETLEKSQADRQRRHQIRSEQDTEEQR